MSYELRRTPAGIDDFRLQSEKMPGGRMAYTYIVHKPFGKDVDHIENDGMTFCSDAYAFYLKMKEYYEGEKL